MQEINTRETKFRIFAALLLFTSILTLSELFALNSYVKHTNFESEPPVQTSLDLKTVGGISTTTHVPVMEADVFSTAARIPQIIHQIYKSSKPSGWGKRAPFIQSWIDKNPNYKHTVYDDDMAIEFVETYFAKYPHIVQAYKKLPLIVSRTDLLRYLLVYHYGGVYADADTTCERPLGNFFAAWTGEGEYRNASFIGGIEWFRNVDNNVPDYLYNSTIINQWTFAASPKHPILWTLVNKIAESTLAASPEFLADKETVIEFTGPAIYTNHIFQYVMKQGEDVEMTIGAGANSRYEAEIRWPYYFKKSQVLLLPVNAFLADAGWRHDRGMNDPYAFVSHAYSGSWPDGWKNVGN